MPKDRSVLIIAEKPTAAKAIAVALAEGKPVENATQENVKWYEFKRGGKNHTVVAAVGHLFTLKQKKGSTYPSADLEWVPTYSASKAGAFSKKYFDVVAGMSGKKWAKYIVATDYDTEGEVIAANVLRLLFNQNDAGRMKFSTMTKDELIDSYEHASPHINFGMAESGMTRHYLDHIWGVSLSRALMAAIKSAGRRFRIMSTGRVQAPTLHMLAKHEKKIKAFKPTPFWQIEAQVLIGKETLKAAFEKDRIWERPEADKILKTAAMKTAAVKDIKKKQLTQRPPKPYNTTSMLADIYRYFGYSPAQAMSIAEALYQAGLISYPRTSSEKLPKDINYKKIISGLAKQKPYEKNCKDLLGKGELKPEEGTKTDPAHPAIYPTGELPKKMGDHQRRVYDLVVRRFLSTFGEPAKRESQRVVLDLGGNNFSITGVRTIEPGWTLLYGRYAAREETLLPELKVGDKVAVKDVKQLSKETQPPARYSQGSVLKEMEQRGLGTKCLAGDAKLISPDGSETRLADLWDASDFLCYDDGIEVRRMNTPATISLNEKIGATEFAKPQLISRRKLKGGEKVIGIATRGGKLKATADHPIYVYSGERICIKPAMNVRKGDRLVSIIARNKLGKILVDEKWFLQRQFKLVDGVYVNRFAGKTAGGVLKERLPIRWSSDLAWILGYFYGDGSYSSPKYNGSHQVCFTTTERKALNLLKTSIKRVFGVEPKAYVVKKGAQYKVQCNSAIAALLASLFPGIKDKSRFEIPQDFAGHFLRGLFDADGNVHLRNSGTVVIGGKKAVGHGVPRVKITLASKELIEWVGDLLRSVGIGVSAKCGKAKLHGKEFACWTILIGGREKVDRFAWKVGFDVEHKRNTMYKGLCSDSPQYHRLSVGYRIATAVKRSDLPSDASQLQTAINCNAYSILKALNRLVKMSVIRRKRLSPHNKQPNRAVYTLIDNDYYLHSLRALYEHIDGDFYAAEVDDVVEDKGEEFVYDVSVSPSSPNFITDGAVLVHNSTRAGILQILYNRGYVVGKSIEVTELGQKLSDILEKSAPDIVSEKLTRHFEQECEAVENGKAKRENIVEEARATLAKILKQFGIKEKVIGKALTDAIIESQEKQSRLGVCPRCGGTIRMHRLWTTKKRFAGCTGYPKCDFSAPLPTFGFITPIDKVCEHCKTPIVQVQRPGFGKPFRMCLDIHCPTKKEWFKKSKLSKFKPKKAEKKEEE